MQAEGASSDSSTAADHGLELSRVLRHPNLGVVVTRLSGLSGGARSQAMIFHPRHAISPMRLAQIVSLLLTAVLLGCASKRSAEEAAAARLQAPMQLPQRFAGYYEYAFERQVFRPCGSGEDWWTWGAPRELQQAPGQRSFVVLQGYVSPEGQYGHLGLYPREIRITGIFEVEPAGQGSDQCPAASENTL